MLILLVLSSLAEPTPGYIDNWYGPTGIIYGMVAGFIRTKIVDNIVTDLIPVDIVANAMIAAAWQRAAAPSNEVKIYNCVSGEQNPITWHEFVTKCTQSALKNPLERTVWYPNPICRTNRTTHAIHEYFAHTIPALVYDGVASLTGKKPL